MGKVNLNIFLPQKRISRRRKKRKIRNRRKIYSMMGFLFRIMAYLPRRMIFGKLEVMARFKLWTVRTQVWMTFLALGLGVGGLVMPLLELVEPGLLDLAQGLINQIQTNRLINKVKADPRSRVISEQIIRHYQLIVRTVKEVVKYHRGRVRVVKILKLNLPDFV